MPLKKTKAPVKNAPRSAKQVIGSRQGVKITLDDSHGKRLILDTPGGHKITMSDNLLTIDIVDSSGNRIKLEPTGITVVATTKVTVRATEVKISAAAINVEAAVSRFTGVLQCDSLVSNSIASASYTPGAGNIW